MESPPAGQPELKRSQRLITRISQLIRRVHPDNWLRRWSKCDADFLPLDHVPGSQSNCTSSAPIRRSEKEREQNQTLMPGNIQNAMILTGERSSIKSDGRSRTGKLAGLMGSAAADASKARASVIAGRLALGHLVVSLGVGHPLIYSIDNLFLRQANVFQTSDLGGAQRAARL